MSRLAARLTRFTRLLAVLALVFLAVVGPREHAASPVYRAAVAPPPPDSCFPAPTNPMSSLSILTPSDGAVLSGTVPLAVMGASATTTSVQVCATYLNPGSGTPVLHNNLPTLTSHNAWASSWDVSAVPNQGMVLLSFIATDTAAGRFLVGTVHVTIDHTPPVSHIPPVSTAIVGLPQHLAPDGTLFVSGSTPITLTVTDLAPNDGSEGTGATVAYSLDGGPSLAYTTPFTLGNIADGAHTITYQGMDGVGNVEAPHTFTVTLDTMPPIMAPPLITGAFGPDGAAYAPVTVAFTATDTGSGVANILYGSSAASRGFYPIGQHIVVSTTTTLYYHATDQVDNQSKDDTLLITINTPTPTVGSLVATTPNPTTPHVNATPTHTPTDTHTPTPTHTPTDTHTPTPTHTPTDTRVPEPTHTPTPTRTPAATHTPIPTRTPAVVRSLATRRAAAATRTPHPAPPWPPLDGPSILKRLPILTTVDATSPGEAIHLHRLPAPETQPHTATTTTKTCKARTCMRAHAPPKSRPPP